MHTDNDIFEDLDIHGSESDSAGGSGGAGGSSTVNAGKTGTPAGGKAGAQSAGKSAAPSAGKAAASAAGKTASGKPQQPQGFRSYAEDEGIFEDLEMEDKIYSSAVGNRRKDSGRTGRSGSPKELNTVDSTLDSRKVSREKAQKKKSRIRSIILWTIIEAITLCAIFVYGYILRNWNLIARPEVKLAAIENHNLSLDKKKEMEGYWNIAVFGVDGRSSDVVGRGLNSDVILVASINKDTGEIRLVSVFRDTYLNISDSNSYNKINQAYAIGGPEQAIAALNKNLDLNIQNYVTFNWKAVADGINILGGVDNIPISKAELYYINAYITETVKATGIGSYQLKNTGEQHLDGVQAVAYGRLRYMDNDFARTERQRRIIKACFEKAKKANFSVLNNIMVVCFPQVATNIGFNDIIAMAQNIGDYNITETGGFPWQRGDAIIGKKGDVVVPATLESNVRYLHEFLFGDTDYTPSDAVLRYSQKIKEDSNYYKEAKFIESVATDGGVIQKPKVNTGGSSGSSKNTENDDEDEEEITLGIDEDGSYIYPTDEDGNIVIPTDEDGNIIYPTDEDGNIIKETTIRPTDVVDGEMEGAPGELDEDESDEPLGPDGSVQRPDDADTNPTREVEDTDSDGEPVLSPGGTGGPGSSSSGSSSGTPGGSSLTPGSTTGSSSSTGSPEDGPGSSSSGSSSSGSPGGIISEGGPGSVDIGTDTSTSGPSSSSSSGSSDSSPTPGSSGSSSSSPDSGSSSGSSGGPNPGSTFIDTGSTDGPAGAAAPVSSDVVTDGPG